MSCEIPFQRTFLDQKGIDVVRMDRNNLQFPGYRELWT